MININSKVILSILYLNNIYISFQIQIILLFKLNSNQSQVCELKFANANPNTHLDIYYLNLAFEIKKNEYIS